jgi:hypothetical protein
MTRIGRFASPPANLPQSTPAEPEVRWRCRSRPAGLAMASALVMAAAGICTDAARSEGLVLPEAVERGGSIEAIYRFDGPVTGRGFIDAEWTDVVGRVVERRRIPLDLAGATEAVFPLDPKRAVTVKNELAVKLSLDETDQSGRPVHRERSEVASFIVSPPDNGWSDYQIIMWQRQTSAGYAALKRLGITVGMVESDRTDKPSSRVMDQVDVMLDADLRWYFENIATDFYSPYHKWYAGRPVNWRFLEAKQRFWKNPQDTGAFIREPSLSDPAWLDKIRDRLIGNVSALKRYRPLYYNLADEPGVADLSAFWDFDLSATSLAAMRKWLKEQYGDLARLNLEWGSTFPSWDAVVPMLTRDAIQRRDQNFAAWGDFKEWMDVAFARALKSGRDAVHAADPQALAAIEGAQIPGWGGYDYARLANGLDLIELYGDNVEMTRSFNPSAVMLTTSFRSGPTEIHRLWRELLRGTRGVILWDSRNEFVGKDGSVGDRGREAAPFFREIRDGVGAMLINSRRRTNPIGILDSPASLRVEWLLDRKGEGAAWSRRNASSEEEDNPIRVSVRNFAGAIEHLGLQHSFVSNDQVERGELVRAGYRVLILPQTIALSAGVAEAILDFVRQGGTVIADGEPGIFDEHGRRLTKPALAQIFAQPASHAAMRPELGKGQAIYFAAPRPGDRDGGKGLSNIFAAVGIEPLVSIMRSDGQPTDDVETYVFENGGITIVALLRDFDPASATPENSPAGQEAIDLKLLRPYEVRDVRSLQALGLTQRLKVELGRVAPVVLALSERPLPGMSISGPDNAHAGQTADFSISSNGNSTAALDIIHVEIADPDDVLVPYYSVNLLVPPGAISYSLPLAVSDKAGTWTIRARNLLTGGMAVAHLEVAP